MVVAAKGDEVRLRSVAAELCRDYVMHLEAIDGAAKNTAVVAVDDLLSHG